MADYQSIGVKPFINASGTLTRIGGSRMAPEVLEAMRRAAGAYVDFNELLQKSGEYLAGLLGVGGALVVNGASAAMMVTLSACMAGTDNYLMRRLPISDGLKNEVIVFKSHRNLYDQAIRQSGAQMREIGLSDFTFEWDLRSAFTDRTCAVVYYAEFENDPGSLPLATVIRIAKEFQVPVIVDAAAELPPVENLWSYYRAGANMVLFSGGKDLRGPQSAGLIVGDREWIEICRRNACPNYSIGRPCKAAKEEIMGLVTAIELYLKEDPAQRLRFWEEQAALVLEALKPFPGLNARRVFPGTDYIRPSVVPRVYFELPVESGWNADRFEQALLAGEPGVILAREGQTMIFNPHMIQPGETPRVAARLVELLRLKPEEK